jgi:hypothetical protein
MPTSSRSTTSENLLQRGTEYESTGSSAIRVRDDAFEGRLHHSRGWVYRGETRATDKESHGTRQDRSMVADLIPPTGKQAFTCPMPFIESGHVTYGDIIIAASYRPDWWAFQAANSQALYVPRFSPYFDSSSCWDI